MFNIPSNIPNFSFYFSSVKIKLLILKFKKVIKKTFSGNYLIFEILNQTES